MTDQITDAELDATFASFFGETEDTAGTGAVTRVVKNELTEVVVNAIERAEFLAQCRAEADARNVAVEARRAAEAKEKTTLDDDLRDEIYGKVAGYQASLIVVPGGQQDGLYYGPVLVEVVVLDTDGATIAYRLSTDAQDDDWQLGSTEDAVETLMNYRERES